MSLILTCKVNILSARYKVNMFSASKTEILSWWKYQILTTYSQGNVCRLEECIYQSDVGNLKLTMNIFFCLLHFLLFVTLSLPRGDYLNNCFPSFHFLESNDSSESKQLKYRYKTTKTLEMTRAFLVEKGEEKEKKNEQVITACLTIEYELMCAFEM